MDRFQFVMLIIWLLIILGAFWVGAVNGVLTI